MKTVKKKTLFPSVQEIQKYTLADLFFYISKEIYL